MAAASRTQLELEPDVFAPGRARSAVVALADGDAELERRLALLTTELVANSVRHAGLREEDRIAVTAERDGDGAVRVEVHDAGRSASEPALRDPDRRGGEGGLGLVLVDKLAAAWGARRIPGDGMAAWFVVR
jgi:serine/threonine-protein kinase RsbW